MLVVLLSQFYFENWFTMDYVRSTIFNVTFAVVVLRKKEEEKKAENPFSDDVSGCVYVCAMAT